MLRLRYELYVNFTLVSVSEAAADLQMSFKLMIERQIGADFQIGHHVVPQCRGEDARRRLGELFDGLKIYLRILAIANSNIDVGSESDCRQTRKFICNIYIKSSHARGKVRLQKVIQPQCNFEYDVCLLLIIWTCKRQQRGATVMIRR
jgi:hypothetical protein